MDLNKDNLINKFLQIESLAYRGRHLVESMSTEKMKIICKRIRHDLEELEVMLGVED